MVVQGDSVHHDAEACSQNVMLSWLGLLSNYRERGRNADAPLDFSLFFSLGLKPMDAWCCPHPGWVFPF